MLFEPMVLIAGGCILTVAFLEKLTEEFGYQWVGTAIKILLPVAGIATGVWFLETNPILRWFL